MVVVWVERNLVCAKLTLKFCGLSAYCSNIYTTIQDLDAVEASQPGSAAVFVPSVIGSSHHFVAQTFSSLASILELCNLHGVNRINRCDWWLVQTNARAGVLPGGP